MGVILTILGLLGKLFVSLLVSAPVVIAGMMLGWSEFVYGSLATQFGLLFFALWIMKFDFKYIKSLFIDKLKAKDIRWTLLAGLSLMAANILFSLLFIKEGFTSDTTANALADGNIVSVFLFPVIIAPFVEELAFRAGLKKVIVENKGYSTAFFVIFSSLVFGLLHWQPGPLGVTIIALTTIMGITKSLFYLKTDNILVTIGGHMIYNGVIMASIAIPQFLMV